MCMLRSGCTPVLRMQIVRSMVTATSHASNAAPDYAVVIEMKAGVATARMTVIGPVAGLLESVEGCDILTRAAGAFVSAFNSLRTADKRFSVDKHFFVAPPGVPRARTVVVWRSDGPSSSGVSYKCSAPCPTYDDGMALQNSVMYGFGVLLCAEVANSITLSLNARGMRKVGAASGGADIKGAHSFERLLSVGVDPFMNLTEAMSSIETFRSSAVTGACCRRRVLYGTIVVLTGVRACSHIEHRVAARNDLILVPQIGAGAQASTAPGGTDRSGAGTDEFRLCRSCSCEGNAARYCYLFYVQ